MCTTSIFLCTMTMISNFTIFFNFQLFIFKYFQDKCNRFSHFHMIPAAHFLIIFFLNLVVVIACSLNSSQNFFIQSLRLYTLCLFSMLLNFECTTCSLLLSIEEIKLIAIVSPSLHVSDFLRLFMMSFKYGLISLRYSSIDSVLFLWPLFLFSI